MAKRRKSKKSFWFKLSHLFRPQASNRYRSKLLHPQSMLVTSFILLAFFALFNAVRFFPNLTDRVLGFSSNISTSDLLDKTNQERQRLGLSKLVLNEELNQAALAKAQDMFNDQYWAHVAPDGKQAWDFIKETDYSYKYAGENLARDFNTSDEVVEAWIASPSHYENLINKDFTQMGLAIVNGNLKGFNTTLVVQLFAVPSSVAMKDQAGSDFYLPKAAEATFHENELVAGEKTANKEIVFSSLNFTKTFFLLVVLLIILTLIYDALIASSRKYQRLVGQNFAHVALFVTVAFLLVLFKGGSVLP
ncbi:CAP domain-containing protein [Patescibacteria group bacterium]|nr:CAP domain-containing protein [Patescibacteria group bacterium]